MHEGFNVADDQPPVESTSIFSSPETLLSPEKRMEIITGVNNELTEEMTRLHSTEAFHNEGHIEDVGSDGMAIIEIFEKYGMAGENEKLAVLTAANGHDLILNHTVVADHGAFNYGQRVRHRGFGAMMPANVKALGTEKGNEELSWEKTREIIEHFDPEKLVYTEKTLEQIHGCIAATYPDAYPATLPEGTTIILDPETGEQVDLTLYLGKDKDGKAMAFRFDQPFLLSNPESDAATLAVAFGDLMYGGKHDARTFIGHGNEEYRELNELVMSDIAAGVDTLSPERKVEIAKSMTAWINSQVGFLLWQKLRFDEVLRTFKPITESSYGEEIKKDLRATYGNFDQNLLAAKDRIINAARFAPLLNTEIYTSNPEAAQTLFTDLLREMDIVQESPNALS